MEPGSLKGLQLVVPDLDGRARELLERGVDPGEIQVVGESPTPQPHPLDNVGFLFFRDPTGTAGGAADLVAGLGQGRRGAPPEAGRRAWRTTSA